MSGRVDDRMERVLRELGGAEPAAGMERRVMLGVEARVAMRSGRSDFRHRPWKLPHTRAISKQAMMWGGAVACFFVIALLFWSVRRAESWFRTPTDRTHPFTGTASLAAPSGGEAVSAFLPEPVVSLRTGRVRERKPRPRAFRSGSELRTPPLTDQEKVLLRIAHERNPVLLADLDSDFRTRREQEDVEEFREFFHLPAKQEPVDISEGVNR